MYKFHSSNSLVAERSIRNFQSLLPSYGPDSSEMSFDFQAGASYINPALSVLQFDVKVTSSATPSVASFGFGYGSAINLLRETKCITRGGTEVQRTTHFNLKQSHHDRQNRSSEWFTTQQAGYNPIVQETDGSFTTDSNGYSLNVFHRFIIPLACVNPLFKTEKLLPSHLMSGLRLDLTLESAANAILAGAEHDATLTYEIKGAKIVLDCMSLTDAASSALQRISAKNSLEVQFVDDFCTSQNMNSTALQLTINKACSRALKCVVISRRTDNLNKTHLDAMLCEALPSTIQWQSRAGNHYSPFAPAQGIEETYHLLRYSSDGPSEIVPEMSTALTLNTLYETHHLIKFSGMSVNNSRTISVNIDYGGTSASREVVACLSYLKIVKVYLQNCVVLS